MHFSLRGLPCQAIPVLAECHLLPHSGLCEPVVTSDREGAGGLTPGHDKTIGLQWNNLTARGKENWIGQFLLRVRQYWSVEGQL